ncbi:MAG: isoprenylcysteine carboxylmethyltransferase family protein [Armatimonadaceae bacterium]
MEPDDAPHMKSPGIFFPPPFLLAIGFLSGLLIHRFYSVPIFPGGRTLATLIISALLLVSGFLMLFTAVLTLFRARTGILPHQSASALVQTGPFRFSRNPMYTAGSLVYLAVALWVNSLWVLLFLPPSLFLLYTIVIRREERYLTQEFGDTYREYCRKVRRWL